jgi:putative membrane protein
MRTLTCALLFAVLSAPAAVSAQNTPSSPSKPGDTSRSADAPKPDPGKPADTTKDTAKKAKLTSNELQIMARYHEDNLMEVQLGTLAAKRGSSQAVKSYGQMLAREHRDFDKQLTGIANKTGQKIPKQRAATADEKKMHADMKKTAANIRKLRGASFDREYLRFMVEDHDHALSNIDTHINDAKHPELAEALRSVKPVLQRHADRARELQKSEAQAMK